MGAAEVDAAVRAARAAQRPWAALAPVERGRILYRMAELVRRDAEALAVLEATDTGKPLRQARADAALAARYFEFYAGAADKHHGQVIPFQPGHQVVAKREPRGVTGHILPWNYPLQMTARTLAPALVTGNTVVLKAAEDACATAIRLFELFAEAGLPAGVAHLITGYGAEAGAALAGHAGIDYLSFTGSTATGRTIMEACARFTRPLTLELGGKSPQLLFADADLDAALPVILNAILQNGGQTCSAGSRLLVEAPIARRVTDWLAHRFNNLSVGPALEDPEVGPLISAKQRDRVSGMLREAVGAGARVVAQTQVPDLPGFFVAPTLLADAAPSSSIQQEEVFGPVLVVTPFRTVNQAVALANGTPYGLTAGIWTRDLSRAHDLCDRVRAGQVFINTYGAGGGVELPFGGTKASGFGREKGMAALDEVTELKTVVLKYL